MKSPRFDPADGPRGLRLTLRSTTPSWDHTDNELGLSTTREQRGELLLETRLADRLPRDRSRVAKEYAIRVLVHPLEVIGVLLREALVKRIGNPSGFSCPRISDYDNSTGILGRRRFHRPVEQGTVLDQSTLGGLEASGGSSGSSPAFFGRRSRRARVTERSPSRSRTASAARVARRAFSSWASEDSSPCPEPRASRPPIPTLSRRTPRPAR